jgi:hypothetical protein
MKLHQNAISLLEAKRFTTYLRWLFVFGPWKNGWSEDEDRDSRVYADRFAKEHGLDSDEVRRYDWDEVPLPKLNRADYLEHKDEIIHCLLAFWKKNSDNASETLQKQLKRAEQVGIDWPELKAIDKSLKATAAKKKGPA